ncbi:restriction endonuclease subunit S [Gilliamella apicola]|uniref:Restriction endonuclease n=1 Tax=Gilliamella apicola TaxID=1196095 RepID=A0A2V4DU00_9GAMM|nr:restriction endonuclease subunit S [Gilliamella apicola]PXZ02527.1 restriction endonuclease [Gilliamella apicola]
MVKTNLGQVTYITTGKLDANSQNANGLYPFFTCGEENLTINTAAFDTEAVLLAGNGNFSVKYYKGKFNAYQRTYVIRPKIVDGKWLYYLVMYHIAKITVGARGSTIKYLRISDITKCPVYLVSLNHQKRIVAKIEELFSELDNGIAALKTAREQLKVYRQAVLKHAFEGKLTAKWREKNADKLESPEQLLARIQQEREAHYQEQLEDWKATVKKWEANGKEGKKPGKPKKLIQLTLQSETSNLKLAFLPAGWSHIKLGNLIDEPVYGTSAKCDYETGEQSVLRIPNISAGIIDDTDLKFANFEKGEIDHLRLMIGDILTIRSNGSISLVGSCGLVKEKDTKHIFAGYLIRLRPNKKMIKSEYLLAAMSSHLIRQQIESAAKSTSGVNNINSSELQNLIIPLTSIQEQEVLISLLDSILPMIKSTEIEIDKQLAKAETLRQSILKKAFSGQLVPQDPSDEPASELLARIQAEKEFVNTQKTKKTNKKQSVSGH